MLPPRGAACRGLLALLAAVPAAACSFDPTGISGAIGGSSPDSGPGFDAALSSDAAIEPRPDSGGGTPDAGTCRDLLPFTPSNFDPCDLGPRAAALSLDEDGTYSLDTDTGSLGSPGGDVRTLPGAVVDQMGAPDLLVIATASFALGPDSTLQMSGTRALALVAIGDLTIAGGGDGGVDVGALGAQSGPGGDGDQGCAAVGRGDPGVAQADPSFDDPAGSGGGGGGFAAAGGAGAAADGVDDAPATDGGNQGGNASLVPLRGGCAGGDGGADGGAGGGAGGALQLVAGGAIIIDGRVSARGGGGGNVTVPHGGGGGGGAGGGLLLEAMTIDVNGAVTANGGGGGEGCRVSVPSGGGEDGGDEVEQAAAGGGGQGSGGDGGAGGARASEGGSDGQAGEASGADLAGGGGGGGSAGRIRLRSIDRAAGIGPQAVVSPAQR